MDLFRFNGSAPVVLPTVIVDADTGFEYRAPFDPADLAVLGYQPAPQRPDDSDTQTSAWDDEAEGWVMVDHPPPPPETEPAPIEVSAVQAKTALYNAGLYGDVETAIGGHPYPLIRIWWSSAQFWRRDHPYVAGMAAEMQLDEDTVDQLFIAAKSVAT